MTRFLFLLSLFVSAALNWPVTAAAQGTDGLPARPTPFRFVTDEAQLLKPEEVKTLESGLRRYADNTGTQIVIVTVPTLGGREVADYGRALGEAWGIGQRDKNNGLVLLLSGQERKVTIQPGSGLSSVITPAVTSRVINQQMTPSFKQGNYYAGLRAGLNTLMLAANPDSNPQKNQAATASGAAAAGAAGADAAAESNLNTESSASAPATQPATEPFSPPAAAPEPESTGLGIGTLAIGALLLGGVVWLLMRLFKRKAAPVAQAPSNASGNAPDFLGNRPTNPTAPGGAPAQPGNYNRGNANNQQQAPDFLGNRSAGMGGGMGGMGSGMGGILATGAAAAAGAYLGNRMASGGNNDSGQHLSGQGNSAAPLDPGSAGAAGAGVAGAGAAGAAAGGSDFPALGGTGATEETAPDYFTDEAANNTEPDYFSSDDTSTYEDNSSYDDMSSGDTGGGDFDSTDDNSGSW